MQNADGKKRIALVSLELAAIKSIHLFTTQMFKDHYEILLSFNAMKSLFINVSVIQFIVAANPAISF